MASLSAIPKVSSELKMTVIPGHTLISQEVGQII